MLDLLIIGGGPCGLATSISAQRAGLSTQLLEAHSVVSTITQYPTYVHFFSTAEKLGLGGLPFIVATDKPSRRDGLTYYRAVVKHFKIPIRQYERVTSIEKVGDHFIVHSDSRTEGERRTETRAVVVATGYFGSPNYLRVPGEDLPHVSHVYREGHEAFDQDVVVVGGGNSAAEASLDLWRSGARVTLVHFGPTFDKKIKPWVGPDFLNREKEGSIATRWDSRVKSIERGGLTITSSRGDEKLKADFIYVMTGFAPNTDLLTQAGVPIDPVTGIPKHNSDTLETTVPNLFIAGVVVAGFDANKVFIENGRFHGDQIVARLLGQGKPPEPKLSAELDT
ncbi:MAG TPA: YpdA family putative bacillithiol disulfide reductase [Gemmatimonadaceae bacterium]